jgi:hypothetical protein
MAGTDALMSVLLYPPLTAGLTLLQKTNIVTLTNSHNAGASPSARYLERHQSLGFVKTNSHTTDVSPSARLTTWPELGGLTLREIPGLFRVTQVTSAGPSPYSHALASLRSESGFSLGAVAS